MGIKEVITAPQTPWQNPFSERLNGIIRQDCLIHVIVLNERHFKRILSEYFAYHHNSRTYLSLEMDCPQPRAIQPTEMGNVRAFPEMVGLHHRYERRVA